MGITPLAPGFAAVRIKPMLGNLTAASYRNFPTVRGPLRRARVRDQLVAPRGRYLFDDAAARGCSAQRLCWVSGSTTGAPLRRDLGLLMDI